MSLNELLSRSSQKRSPLRGLKFKGNKSISITD
jgi:hypothetical protein